MNQGTLQDFHGSPDGTKMDSAKQISGDPDQLKALQSPFKVNIDHF